MNRWKRWASAALSLTLLTGLLPVTAWAAELRQSGWAASFSAAQTVETAEPAESDSGTCGENLAWNFDADSGKLTISGSGEMEDYTQNNTPWNADQYDIQTVVIESGVTSIGEFAFSGCSNMNMITIPADVASIGRGAFFGCASLTSIAIPAGVTSIEASTFINCTALAEVTLPDTVKRIGDSAFHQCHALKDLTLPSGLTSIGERAFYACRSLTKVEIPNGVTYLGDYAFSVCNALTSVAIPSSVTSMGNYLFENSGGLTSVTIPDGITRLGYGMFHGCSSLASVVLPDSVTEIHDNAFSGCEQLADVYYAGSEADWKNITISGTGNEPLNTATIHYNWTGPETEHTYVIGKVTAGTENSLTVDGVVYPLNILAVHGDDFVGDYVCCTLTDGVVTDVNTLELASGTLESWDETQQLLTIDDAAYHIYEGVTDLSFLDALDALKGTQVQFLKGDGPELLQDYVYRVFSLNWAVGIVTAVSTDSITIGATRYVLSGIAPEADIWVGMLAAGKLENGAVTQLVTLSADYGTLNAYDSNAQTVTVDGVGRSCEELSAIDQAGLEDLRGTAVLALYWAGDVYGLVTGAVVQTGELIDVDPDAHTLTVQVGGATGTGTYLYWDWAYGSDWELLEGSNVQVVFYGDKAAVVKERSVTAFQLETYRADYLLDGDGADVLERTMNGNSPTRILVDALQNDSHFADAAATWETMNMLLSAVNNPATATDVLVERQDLYAALTLQILQAATEVGFADSLESALTMPKSILSNFASACKTKYEIDILEDYKGLTDAQLSETMAELKRTFSETFPLTLVNQTFSAFSQEMKVFDNLESYIEYLYSGMALMEMSDSLKAVVREMYARCPASQVYLKLALADCVDILDSSTEEFLTRAAGRFFAASGVQSAQFLVGEFWNTVTNTIQTAYPALGYLMVGCQVGKLLSNALFSTDSTVVAYNSMLALLEIEDLAGTTYRAMEENYRQSGSQEDAAVLLSAADILFQVMDSDCLAAYEFVDVLASSAYANSILAYILNLLNQENEESETFQSVKEAIAGFQRIYAVRHETVLTGWINHLEEDYPGSGLEEEYAQLLEESSQRIIEREYLIACPVDVYVYDKQDELVGSVIHGEVWCGGELTVMAEGSAKTVWLYAGTNYRLELEGTDTGTMDVISRALDKDGNVTRTTSYDALPLSANTVYQIEPDADAPVQTEPGEPVTPTQDTETGSQTYTLTVCSGVAELDGTTGAVLPVQAGQIVTVTAWIPNGYAFEGWTAETGVLGDTSQPVTTFRMPEGDVVVTAALRSEPSQPERVTVTPETVELSVGDTYTLSASVTPAGTGGAITWASTDPEVAVVQENGQVTAMGQGTASIVAATEQGRLTAACLVTVTAAEQPGTGTGGGSTGGGSAPNGAAGGDQGPDAAPGTAFTDVPEDAWYTEAVSYVVEQGLMNGTGGGRFHPMGTADRAMLVTILYRLAGEPEGSDPAGFPDVADGAWYADAVNWAAAQGIAAGYADGRFAPADALTREQIAALLYRYAAGQEAEVSASADLSGYADGEQTSGYAVEAMRWAVGAGLLTGKDGNRLDPRGTATRAELAAILMRFCEKGLAGEETA